MKFFVQHFQSIDSTNRYCMRELENLQHGTVISASVQSAGRGRLNRSWHSPSNKNLYFSVVLKSERLAQEKISAMPMLAALAVNDCLKNLKVGNSWIKWPNDVFADDKKICGILCESSYTGKNLQGLVVGIGVNINADAQDLAAINMPASSVPKIT